MMRETIIAFGVVRLVQTGREVDLVAFSGEGFPPGAPAGLTVVGGGDADSLLEYRAEVAEGAVADVEADLGDGEGTFEQEFLAVIDAQFG